MSIIEIKKQIRNNIKWTTGKSITSGGQTCGMIPVDITLESEELCFKVTIGNYRSQLKNKEFALILFELALDEFMNYY